MNASLIYIDINVCVETYICTCNVNLKHVYINVHIETHLYLCLHNVNVTF